MERDIEEIEEVDMQDAESDELEMI
jgi:hypothetical protein